jgi:hypothetical protein
VPSTGARSHAFPASPVCVGRAGSSRCAAGGRGVGGAGSSVLMGLIWLGAGSLSDQGMLNHKRRTRWTLRAPGSVALERPPPPPRCPRPEWLAAAGASAPSAPVLGRDLPVGPAASPRRHATAAPWRSSPRTATDGAADCASGDSPAGIRGTRRRRLRRIRQHYLCPQGSHIHFTIAHFAQFDHHEIGTDRCSPRGDISAPMNSLSQR